MQRLSSIAIFVATASVAAMAQEPVGPQEGNRSEIDVLRAELAELNADHERLLVRVVELTDELHQSEREERKLEEQCRTLVARWARAIKVVREGCGLADGVDP